MISELSVGAEMAGTAPRPRPRSSNASVYGKRIQRATTAHNRRGNQQDDETFDFSHGYRAHPCRVHHGDAAWNTNGDRQLAVPSVSRAGTGYAAPPGV